MIKYFLISIGIVLTLCSTRVLGQGYYNDTTRIEKEEDHLAIDTSRYVHFFNDTDPLLEFVPEEEEKEFKKKKPKKKVFYGIKTKKGFTKKGYGDKQQLEVFYYIPQYIEPVPYVKDVYSFNLKKFKLEKGRKKLEPEISRLLHGPYKKVVNGLIMEYGVYYKGVKHARWEKYSKEKTYTYKDTIEISFQPLLSKRKYNRGWPKDSELSYYDAAKKKLKEAIPIVEDDRHGYYVSYFESGRMSKQGNYVHGYRAGTWISYFDKGSRTSYRKLLVKFPRDPLKEDPRGQIMHEWNDEGKTVYDFEQEKKKTRKDTPIRYLEDEVD